MTGNLIIHSAGELVTVGKKTARRGKEMSQIGVIADGAVKVTGGVITAVGTSSEIMSPTPPPEYTIIDARGRSVIPGFVDAHTHFVFGGYREKEFSWRLSGMRYTDILANGGGILDTVRATRETPSDALLALALERLDSMMAFGVTTVEGKSGYGLDLETELRVLEVMAEANRRHPVDVVPTFLGAHAVAPEYRGRTDDYIDFIITRMLPEVTRRGLAAFCDIFCEQGVFSVAQSRRLLTAARKKGLGLKLHADEMASLGGAELAVELGAVSADHLLSASETGIAGLAGSDTIATLLPATAFVLGEPFARAREMIDAGCAVALATDMNPGSSFTESIPLVAALAALKMQMTPEEILTALTLNGAAAVDRADRVGSIAAGKMGDILILEAPSIRFIPYHTGVNIVDTVIKNGTVIHQRKERAAQ
ncbi:MAG: imidazolonepropionase [Pseudomonadota bacterium]